jgi:hypothetical protein
MSKQYKNIKILFLTKIKIFKFFKNNLHHVLEISGLKATSSTTAGA